MNCYFVYIIFIIIIIFYFCFFIRDFQKENFSSINNKIILKNNEYIKISEENWYLDEINFETNATHNFYLFLGSVGSDKRPRNPIFQNENDEPENINKGNIGYELALNEKIEGQEVCYNSKYNCFLSFYRSSIADNALQQIISRAESREINPYYLKPNKYLQIINDKSYRFNTGEKSLLSEAEYSCDMNSTRGNCVLFSPQSHTYVMGKMLKGPHVLAASDNDWGGGGFTGGGYTSENGYVNIWGFGNGPSIEMQLAHNKNFISEPKINMIYRNHYIIPFTTHKSGDTVKIKGSSLYYNYDKRDFFNYSNTLYHLDLSVHNNFDHIVGHHTCKTQDNPLIDGSWKKITCIPPKSLRFNILNLGNIINDNLNKRNDNFKEIYNSLPFDAINPNDNVLKYDYNNKILKNTILKYGYIPLNFNYDFNILLKTKNNVKSRGDDCYYKLNVSILLNYRNNQARTEHYYQNINDIMLALRDDFPIIYNNGLKISNQKTNDTCYIDKYGNKNNKPIVLFNESQKIKKPDNYGGYDDWDNMYTYTLKNNKLNYYNLPKDYTHINYIELEITYDFYVTKTAKGIDSETDKLTDHSLNIIKRNLNNKLKIKFPDSYGSGRNKNSVEIDKINISYIDESNVNNIDHADSDNVNTNENIPKFFKIIIERDNRLIKIYETDLTYNVNNSILILTQGLSYPNYYESNLTYYPEIWCTSIDNNAMNNTYIKINSLKFNDKYSPKDIAQFNSNYSYNSGSCEYDDKYDYFHHYSPSINNNESYLEYCSNICDDDELCVGFTFNDMVHKTYKNTNNNADRDEYKPSIKCKIHKIHENNTDIINTDNISIYNDNIKNQKHEEDRAKYGDNYLKKIPRNQSCYIKKNINNNDVSEIINKKEEKENQKKLKPIIDNFNALNLSFDSNNFNKDDFTKYLHLLNDCYNSGIKCNEGEIGNTISAKLNYIIDNNINIIDIQDFDHFGNDINIGLVLYESYAFDKILYFVKNYSNVYVLQWDFAVINNENLYSKNRYDINFDNYPLNDYNYLKDMIFDRQFLFDSKIKWSNLKNTRIRNSSIIQLNWAFDLESLNSNNDHIFSNSYLWDEYGNNNSFKSKYYIQFYFIPLFEYISCINNICSIDNINIIKNINKQFENDDLWFENRQKLINNIQCHTNNGEDFPIYSNLIGYSINNIQITTTKLLKIYNNTKFSGLVFNIKCNNTAHIFIGKIFNNNDNNTINEQTEGFGLNPNILPPNSFGIQITLDYNDKINSNFCAFISLKSKGKDNYNIISKFRKHIDNNRYNNKINFESMRVVPDDNLNLEPNYTSNDMSLFGYKITKFNYISDPKISYNISDKDNYKTFVVDYNEVEKKLFVFSFSDFINNDNKLIRNKNLLLECPVDFNQLFNNNYDLYVVNTPLLFNKEDSTIISDFAKWNIYTYAFLNDVDNNIDNSCLINNYDQLTSEESNISFDINNYNYIGLGKCFTEDKKIPDYKYIHNIIKNPLTKQFIYNDNKTENLKNAINACAGYCESKESGNGLNSDDDCIGFSINHDDNLNDVSCLLYSNKPRNSLTQERKTYYNASSHKYLTRKCDHSVCESNNRRKCEICKEINDSFIDCELPESPSFPCDTYDSRNPVNMKCFSKKNANILTGDKIINIEQNNINKFNEELLEFNKEFADQKRGKSNIIWKKSYNNFHDFKNDVINNKQNYTDLADEDIDYNNIKENPFQFYNYNLDKYYQFHPPRYTSQFFIKDSNKSLVLTDKYDVDKDKEIFEYIEITDNENTSFRFYSKILNSNETPKLGCKNDVNAKNYDINVDIDDNSCISNFCDQYFSDNPNKCYNYADRNKNDQLFSKCACENSDEILTLLKYDNNGELINNLNDRCYKCAKKVNVNNICPILNS